MNKFGEPEIKKHKFRQQKKTILIYDVGIIKVFVSNEVSVCKRDFKYFIDYKNGKKVRKDFEETKCMLFWIKNGELLEKYDGIWNKVSNANKK